MNVLPLVAKVPKLIGTAYKTVDERQSMEDIMRGARARAIWPADPANPRVVRLAAEVGERMWAKQRDERKKPGAWQSVVG